MNKNTLGLPYGKYILFLHGIHYLHVLNKLDNSDIAIIVQQIYSNAINHLNRSPRLDIQPKRFINNILTSSYLSSASAVMTPWSQINFFVTAFELHGNN